MFREVEKLFVPISGTLQDAVACIDRNQQGIALVVDEQQQLVGTVVDGDIRRAVLASRSADTPLRDILAVKPERYRVPVTAPITLDPSALVRLMHERSVRHIPLIDEAGRVVALFSMHDVIATGAEAAARDLPITALVMAGGLGTRLRPLTDTTPKPMLYVGDRPMIQWILEGVRDAGVRRFIVTTYYMADKITSYLGDGSQWGIHIEYIHEDKLTGTAGPLASLRQWETPLLVINGDILTRVDFRAMYAYHREHNARMTVAVREHQVTVPYGVMDIQGAHVMGIREKPTLSFFVNAGIYLIEPTVRPYLKPEGEYLDMPTLIEALIASGEAVAGFPVTEYWMDIGHHGQYEQAQRDISHITG